MIKRNKMLLHTSGQLLLRLMLLITSVHSVIVTENGLHSTTESSSPSQCPMDVSEMIRMMNRERLSQAGSTSASPSQASETISFQEMDDTKLRFAISHPVVSPLQGVFQGLRYTVLIEVVEIGHSFDALFMQSTKQGLPYGSFKPINESISSLPSSVRFCRHSPNKVWSASYSNMFSLIFEWQPDSLDPVIGCINITAVVRQGSKWHHKTLLLCQKEANCHHHSSLTYATLQEKDLQQSGRVQNCSEHIIIIQFTEEYQAFIQFQSVNLLFSKIPECTKEYIEVNTFERQRWIGNKFCGYLDYRKLARLHFSSQEEAIIIRVKLISRSTFKAVHYLLDRNKGCNNTVTSSRGTVTSPNFPSHYLPRMDCYVHIAIRNGERGIIRLRHLSLDRHSGGSCGSDYLEVEVSSSPLGAGTKRRFCGELAQYSHQYTTLFTSVNITVHFHSDWLDESNGFLLDYAISTSCGQDILRAANESVFADPESIDSVDVSDSNRWQDCFATIHVPYGYIVELHATAQETLPSSDSSDFQGSQFRRVGNGIEDDDDTALNNETFNCIDGFLEIFERNATWILCDLNLLTHANHVSSSNTLMVRLVRDRFQYLPKASIGYGARPVNHSEVIECAYGWVPGTEHSCYMLVETFMAWETAERYCQNEGGHLVSVPNLKVQLLLDAIITNSLLHDDGTVFWTGGNDRMFENYFEWANNQPMSYTNWFQGWSQYNYYNRQPSDDGLSNQDCIELRRKFAYPAKGYGTKDSFFWNDRDCSVANPFICEKLKVGALSRPYPISCNRTINLTITHPGDVITSPAYPESYPSNMDCSTIVTAPSEYRIVITFVNFVLEDGPVCEYDYMEIAGSANEQQRYCGNWINRLKLLRHKSVSNQMVIKFESDFSHSYKGFMAHVHLQKEDTFCDEDWLLRYNDYCYLLITFPTVTWQTAQQICLEKQAHLVSIRSQEEELFLEEEISKHDPHNSGMLYWLGGHKSLRTTQSWSWSDASPFTYSAFYNTIRESGNAIIDWSKDDSQYGELCLALQWRANGELLESKFPSNRFYWFGQSCVNSASYICKKKSFAPPISNVTICGTDGNISSPNYPAMYVNNQNFNITLLGPSMSRIIVNFLYLDIEFQEDCLYDYVAIQSSASGAVTRFCGPNDANHQRPEYISDSHEVRITFNTDYANVGGGFFATWTTVDVSSCPYKSVHTDSGELISLNFPNPYLNNVECVTEVQLPYSTLERWIWIQFDTFIVGNGNGGDLSHGEICPDDYLELTLGSGNENPLKKITLCGNLSNKMQHLGFMTNSSEVKLFFSSNSQGRFKGFRAIYQTLLSPEIQHIVHLNANTSGIFHELNYPLVSPRKANYTQKLVLPIGYIVHLELKGFRAQQKNKRSADEFNACSKWSMEIYDPYAKTETKSGKTTFCRAKNESVANEFLVSSYLNVLYLRERIDESTRNGGYFRMVHSTTRDPGFNNKTSTITGGRLESCDPNPCQNRGICSINNGFNTCQCGKQYIGMFCQLSLCDQTPCVNGTCKLSADGYACSCNRGYIGVNCNIKINPCASNPCGNRGICTVKKDNFVCKCQIWWQGPQCDTKGFKFTYRPLSQRMLEEPFWLGLITVFVVLTILGCFWCIKRKFADKLEKFISEEIERNKSQSACKANKRHSLRDQASPLSLSPHSCRKSLLTRIGIRKHSMLSFDSSGSSNYHENRSYSFDDIKKSDSQRRLDKLGSSSPPMKLDKKELLHSLVAPGPVGSKGRRMSLDEFIQMSERRILERNSFISQDNCDSISEEASFELTSSPTNQDIQGVRAVVARQKRVNFQRTLEKIDSVSFENERDDDINLGVMVTLSSANKALFVRPDSTDISDGDTSLCSSIYAFPEEDNLTNSLEYATEEDRQKVQTITDLSDCSSIELDSSWTSSEHLNATEAEVKVEVHKIPTIPFMLKLTENNTKSEDCKTVFDESIAGPTSIIAITSPESPTTIKHKCTIGGSCAYVPVIHSLQKNSHMPHILKSPKMNAGTNFTPAQTLKPANKTSAEGNTLKPHAQNLTVSPMKKALVRQETIKYSPDAFENLSYKLYNTNSLTSLFNSKTQLEALPKEERISCNVTEQCQTATLQPPEQIDHLSNKPLLQNMEQISLLGSPKAPIITITSNISSCESDTDSPTKTTPRMHYLSPFDIIHQNGERSTSLSNLSSSGYSSMTSPGPSRCNSNSPLFDDMISGSNNSPMNMYRKYGQHLTPTNLTPHPVSPKHGPKGNTIPKTGELAGNSVGQEKQMGVRLPLLRAVPVMRKRSNSEPMDDLPEAARLPEDSNDDEGIDMDHIEYKIHRGEVTSAKDLEMYMDKGKVGIEGEKGTCSNRIGNNEELAGVVQEPVCPSITIQNILHADLDHDRCEKFVRRKSFQRKLSPVSSRSESPMSDNGGASVGVNLIQNQSENVVSPTLSGSKEHYDDALYNNDTDEAHEDVSDSEIAHTVTNKTESRSAMLMHGVQQARKQAICGKNSDGNKLGKSSSAKLRPRMIALSADRVPKHDRYHKLSPKRSTQLQNSLAADASTSDSSSMRKSPRKMLFSTKDYAQNKNAYRKCLIVSRCESLPINISLTDVTEPTDGSSKLSKVNRVNGTAQILHSLSDSAAGKEVEDDADYMFDNSSLSSLPYQNLSEELIPNEMLTDDCRDSEVSFYLDNSSSRLADKKSNLSPSRVSPDMSIICHGARGLGQSCSEEDDMGLF